MDADDAHRSLKIEVVGRLLFGFGRVLIAVQLVQREEVLLEASLGPKPEVVQGTFQRGSCEEAFGRLIAGGLTLLALL